MKLCNVVILRKRKLNFIDSLKQMKKERKKVDSQLLHSFSRKKAAYIDNLNFTT